MQLTTTFTLHQPTKGTWLRWWPFGYRSLIFPPGNYELAFDGVSVKWRYLGPHLSTKGTHVDAGGVMVPIGYVGPFEFAGDWFPGGHVIQPPQEWITSQGHLYARMEGMAKAGQIGPLLKHMIQLVGD